MSLPGKDSTSVVSEKLAAALKKASMRSTDLRKIITILWMTKDDDAADQICRLETELATVTEKINRLKSNSGSSVTLSTVTKTMTINECLYPGKGDNDIKAHLESVCKLEIGAVHTHVLLSASVSKGLRSYVQVVTKGKPNLYVLWCALKDCFHNKSVNLQANLQQFSLAHKETDKHMMDYITKVG
jgi:hypothetical protein